VLGHTQWLLLTAIRPLKQLEQLVLVVQVAQE
jgi:hypothetical protein